MGEECKKRINELFNSDDFNSYWVDGKATLGNAIKKMIKENVGEMFESMISNMVHNTMENIRRNAP